MKAISKFLVFLFALSRINAFHSQDVKFSIYAAEKTASPKEIQPQELCGCEIDETRRIFVIIHGWLYTGEHAYMKDIRETVFGLKDKKSSVIEVEWIGISRKDYDDAKAYNEYVANATAGVLSSLIKDYKFRHANIEIICHCMGCHIAGVAAKKILHRTGKRIGRITALDPAGPGYYNLGPEHKLTPDDAEIVFVIHTDSFVFGYGDNCGTIDFYPNGGKSPQPGCCERSKIVEYDLCSHRKSIHYYLESLNCSTLCGIRCSSYRDYMFGICSTNPKVNLAGPLTKKNFGTYFSKTNKKSPFVCVVNQC